VRKLRFQETSAIDFKGASFIFNTGFCSSPTAATNSKTRLVDEGRKRILLIAASIRAGGTAGLHVKEFDERIRVGQGGFV
jgi:hypothetical protein